MGLEGMNNRKARLTVVGSQVRSRKRSAEFVRLSGLRKLRECEQVAAVCYRVRGGGIEFLLVQTRGSSGRWTFPKGSAEPGLTHAQAAALEAFEEAGVHGRIEEASFTRYVLGKRGDAHKSASRSSEKGVGINAHLCEVLRLGPAQESKRNRTWFSEEDARRRLRDGRNTGDGDEFARVVSKAVARIQRFCEAFTIAADRAQDDRSQRYVMQTDALQRVQFEALAEAPAQYIRRQLGEVRYSSAPKVDVHRHEVLQCEVLQFDPPREGSRSDRWISVRKKAKALGTGTRNG
jgi:8-oxo-dGTP pyrophosphatase MutT (NUDIX family)